MLHAANHSNSGILKSHRAIGPRTIVLCLWMVECWGLSYMEICFAASSSTWLLGYKGQTSLATRHSCWVANSKHGSGLCAAIVGQTYHSFWKLFARIKVSYPQSLSVSFWREVISAAPVAAQHMGSHGVGQWLIHSPRFTSKLLMPPRKGLAWTKRFLSCAALEAAEKAWAWCTSNTLCFTVFQIFFLFLVAQKVPMVKPPLRDSVVSKIVGCRWSSPCWWYIWMFPGAIFLYIRSR